MPKGKRKEIIMNATTSTNTTVRFTINFFGKQIIGTKASFDKAGKGFGAEYEELIAKMNAHPDFELVIKEQKHRSAKAKKTYDGLDFALMEDYISIQEDADTIKKEYKAVKEKAKTCGISVYPFTKKWFLKKFENFDVDTAKEAISDYRMSEATATAA